MTVSVPVLPLRWLTFVRVPISSFETLKRRRPNTRDGAVADRGEGGGSLRG